MLKMNSSSSPSLADDNAAAATPSPKEKKSSSVSRLLRTSTFGESSPPTSGVGPRKESAGRRPLSAIFMAKKHAVYQLENNRSRSEDTPDNKHSGIKEVEVEDFDFLNNDEDGRSPFKDFSTSSSSSKSNGGTNQTDGVGNLSKKVNCFHHKKHFIPIPC